MLIEPFASRMSCDLLGMVQADVGQKLVESNILRVFVVQ